MTLLFHAEGLWSAAPQRNRSGARVNKTKAAGDAVEVSFTRDALVVTLSDGSGWMVLAERQPEVFGGRRLIKINEKDNVTAYGRGR